MELETEDYEKMFRETLEEMRKYVSDELLEKFIFLVHKRQDELNEIDALINDLV